MVAYRIRPASVDDAAVILRFIRELADYEKALHEVAATEEHCRFAVRRRLGKPGRHLRDRGRRTRRLRRMVQDLLHLAGKERPLSKTSM